jgi:hypothetical protein
MLPMASETVGLVENAGKSKLLELMFGALQP